MLCCGGGGDGGESDRSGEGGRAEDAWVEAPGLFRVEPGVRGANLTFCNMTSGMHRYVKLMKLLKNILSIQMEAQMVLQLFVLKMVDIWQ